MKAILLNADSDLGWTARYCAALPLARAFDGHVLCVQNTPFAETRDRFFGYYPYPEIAAELHEQDRQHRLRAEERLRHDGIEWDWLESSDGPAQTLLWRSRLADLTIVTSDGYDRDDLGTDALVLAGTLAIHARGPILAVPADLAAFDPLGTAVIAWNGSPEAASALRQGLPLLGRARNVSLVAVAEEGASEPPFTAGEAVKYLARHGVHCEDHGWDRGDGPVAEVVLDAAAALKADYIVAGAYGHTRMREAILGGTTRALLRNSLIPLLMAH